MISEALDRITRSEDDVRKINQLADGITQADLPADVADFVKAILDHAANGRPVTAFESDDQISPEIAAGMIGVSRPLLMDLLNQGRIPYTKTAGGHYKIAVNDVRQFIAERQKFAQEVAQLRASRKTPRALLAEEFGLTELEAKRFGIL